MITLKLPKALTQFLDLSEIERPKIGFSFEKVYFLNHGYLEKNVVLKTSNRKEVYQEGLILSWFKDKIKVPEVYFNICIDQTYYLIMEKLDGCMMQEAIFDQGIEKGIQMYASLIKQIHEIDATNFPVEQSLEKRVAEAKFNVENHLVRTQYFEREIKDKTGQEVFDLLLKYYPKKEDLVIVHGDVCMPNFILNHHKFNGMIDVGRAGINDRYLDIAIALRTLRYNIELQGQIMTKTHKELFLKTYGITQFNQEKFYFYLLLDELING